jgi:hypothetical protein
MRNVVIIVLGLLFVASYAGANIAFNLFLDWYDTGASDLSLGLPAGIAGAFIGGTALWIEMKRYHRGCATAQRSWRFYGQLIGFSLFYLMFCFALTQSILPVYGTGVSLQTLIAIPIVLFLGLFMALFYSVLMLPFGICTGIFSGILFWSLVRIGRQPGTR